jgi:hypothetical protein
MMIELLASVSGTVSAYNDEGLILVDIGNDIFSCRDGDVIVSWVSTIVGIVRDGRDSAEDDKEDGDGRFQS